MTKAATKAPEQTEDRYEVGADGRVKVTVDGKDYTLRRPKIGEQWDFEEKLTAVQEMEIAVAKWRVEAFEGSFGDLSALGEGKVDDDLVKRLQATSQKIDPKESYKRERQVQEARVGWWIEDVLPKLCPDLAALGPFNLPTFFAHTPILNESLRAWSGNPPVPGAG